MVKRALYAGLFFFGLLILLKGCPSGNNADSSFGSGSWLGNPAAGNLSVTGGRFSGRNT